MLENNTISIDSMYSKQPAYVYGFHGCTKETFEAVLYNHEPLRKSNNSYDWLGNGVYFWENSYQRAVEWAKKHYGENGVVIGAFIDLGYCLDTTDYSFVELFKLGYELLKHDIEDSKSEMPCNRHGHSKNDLLLRDLDCAVIERIHDYSRQTSGMRSFNSVRGTFEEGTEMYPGAGFKEKTHTQICIVNPNCIKGYFAPKRIKENFVIP